MSGQASVNHLDLLRSARRAAADLRKVFLAVYGLLIVVPLVLLLVAAGRAALFGDFLGQIGETVLWPVQSTADLFRGAFAEGLWGLMAAVVVGAWLIAIFVGSFFGLAVTRMTADEQRSLRPFASPAATGTGPSSRPPRCSWVPHSCWSWAPWSCRWAGFRAI
jgi:hypothetical protein